MPRGMQALCYTREERLAAAISEAYEKDREVCSVLDPILVSSGALSLLGVVDRCLGRSLRRLNATSSELRPSVAPWAKATFELMHGNSPERHASTYLL